MSGGRPANWSITQPLSHVDTPFILAKFSPRTLAGAHEPEDPCAKNLVRVDPSARPAATGSRDHQVVLCRHQLRPHRIDEADNPRGRRRLREPARVRPEGAV